MTCGPSFFACGSRARTCFPILSRCSSLCLDSVSTFCVLGRHALLAAGAEAKTDRRAVVRQLGVKLKMDVTPFEILLDLREDKPGPETGDPGELFAAVSGVYPEAG